MSFFFEKISFDPVRIFFINSKITQNFNPQEYSIYQRLRRETVDRLLTYRNKDDDPDDSLTDLSSWFEREQEGVKLKNWLKEKPGLLSIHSLLILFQIYM